MIASVNENEPCRYSIQAASSYVCDIDPKEMPDDYVSPEVQVNEITDSPQEQEEESYPEQEDYPSEQEEGYPEEEESYPDQDRSVSSEPQDYSPEQEEEYPEHQSFPEQRHPHNGRHPKESILRDRRRSSRYEMEVGDHDTELYRHDKGVTKKRIRDIRNEIEGLQRELNKLMKLVDNHRI